jgi:glycosyltransferase involved in cell wall biosynthesis
MHFVIVSYTFPPSKGIGGRRWAKFSQYLKKQGNKVTVITADVGNHADFYTKEFKNIQIIQLPKCYPSWLTGEVTSLVEKFKYRFYTKILAKIDKRNYFDTAFQWESQLIKALGNFYQQSPFDVLVVTGAPFSLMEYGATFKRLHPTVKYVIDFRDPWTWGDYYGIPKMNKRKRVFQEYQEKYAIQNADLVCYPTENMGERLKSLYPNEQGKMSLLPHAYDTEKFKDISFNSERNGFIYGGTLYNGIEAYLTSLSKVLKDYPGSAFKWNIYTGNKLPVFEKLFSEDQVKINGFVPESDLFAKIASSKAYLAFFPETDKDLISTKFFEIIYTGTPILYIGAEGAVARFIRDNRLGVHILPENIIKELPAYLNGNVPFEKDYFDVSQFTFENVTKEFTKTIEGLFKKAN